MKRLMLVRHAEPSIDIDVPAEEWSLTGRGVSSTTRLAGVLSGFGPTVIIASPERKAIETGRLLSESLELPFEQEDRFSEHGAGPGEFLADYAEFRALVKRHFDHPDETVMRGESSRAAGLRLAEGLAARFPAETSLDVPVIVSHGRIMAAWLESLTGSGAWGIWTELRMPDLIEVDLTARTSRSIDVPLF